MSKVEYKIDKIISKVEDKIDKKCIILYKYITTLVYDRTELNQSPRLISLGLT